MLLHGNGESHAVFERQMDEFSARYRVLAVDTRGHGASPRGGAPFTLSQFADDLHEFLLERGILRAHLLGFSDGGNIAALFALRYPDMPMHRQSSLSREGHLRPAKTWWI